MIKAGSTVGALVAVLAVPPAKINHPAPSPAAVAPTASPLRWPVEAARTTSARRWRWQVSKTIAPDESGLTAGPLRLVRGESDAILAHRMGAGLGVRVSREVAQVSNGPFYWWPVANRVPKSVARANGPTARSGSPAGRGRDWRRTSFSKTPHCPWAACRAWDTHARNSRPQTARAAPAGRQNPAAPER